MRATIIRFADALRGSYWFLPTVMALLAAILAGVMILLDSYEGSAWLDGIPWLYDAHPDGARQMLSIIGGSMVTVAGTVFSVTIAAVVYASGQYGPRLLSNFMSDRGNQVTLGTFIATFVYCLLVLRTVRSADEVGGAAGFVPNLAVLVAVILAICSIAVLIFFIHHVPSKLHINSVIEEIGDRLITEIDDRFPAFIGSGSPSEDQPGEPPSVPEAFRASASQTKAHRRQLIAASHTGYIQLISHDVLLNRASKSDLVLRLQYQSGDFVHKGRTLVEAWPPERCTDADVEDMRDAFAVGARRSALQDMRFLIDELVEIAARALSPGVNDPFTAMTCLDWLGAATSDLAIRKLPSHLRVDEEGDLRVIAHPITFDRLVQRSFGSLAQYCSKDMIASLHFVAVITEVSLDCDDPARLAALSRQVDELEDLCSRSLSGANLARVRQRSADFRRALTEPDFKRSLRDSIAWVAGSA